MANELLKLHGIIATDRNEDNTLKLVFTDIELSTMEPITLQTAKLLYSQGIKILKIEEVPDYMADYLWNEELAEYMDSNTEEYYKEIRKLLLGDVE